ncbi:hypothetical protein PHYSODRAFT_449221, partial [Phytophthora sojae]
CLITSTMLYPIAFRRLDSVGQIFYVGLVPVIKIIGRNVISGLIGDRYDMKAETVIFHVEVFSVLCMSVALHDSAKLTTTLAVMAVDVVQSKVTLNDIDKMMNRTNIVLLANGH